MSRKATKSNPTPGDSKLPCGRKMPEKSQPTSADTEELMALMLERLNRYVTAQKLNYSEARAKILDTIVHESRHFSATELLQRLQKRYPEVGKATLYRNLPVLVASELINEGPTAADGQILYELSDNHHHDHIVCIDCQNIFEFHDASIEKTQANVAERIGFSVKSHRHVIYATCHYMAEQRRKKTSR